MEHKNKLDCEEIIVNGVPYHTGLNFGAGVENLLENTVFVS